tara:strand:- start:1289 stop:3226 length:1938 start_codon:yes stop_codon:yes gene_type:complete
MINIINLPRSVKRLILIAIDIVVLSLTVYLSLALRTDEFFSPSEGYPLADIGARDIYTIIFLSPLVTIPVFVYFKLYRSITRYISYETYIKIFKASIISTIFWVSMISVLNLAIPRSVILINFVISIAFVSLSRMIARNFLITRAYNVNYKNVLLYGVDETSIRVSELLKNITGIKLLGFISDDSRNKNTIVSDIPVYLKKDILEVIKLKNIHEIYLILDNNSDGDDLKNKLIELNNCPIKIRKIPNMDDFNNMEFNINSVKEIDIEDLLKRKAVVADPYLLKTNIENKTVMVTGCGGSIGSELSRQILNLKPKKLILLDHSEYSLYSIDYEISEIIQRDNLSTEVVSYLDSVVNNESMQTIFKKENINTVYHSAAYKHVPLIEKNPLAAIKTNILGTYTISKVASEHNVDNFILISSDKAVRPTNVMGATKRFAELILQALQVEIDKQSKIKCKTKFSMVRFGNVLDTSGSVIPLFRKQIEKGGPVTVTDPRVTRYFMTIQEAAELVIQAGSLSKSGGEIFILEMGKSINIHELAKDMIRLSDNFIKDPNVVNSEGIEIIFTGLRPGEKLYEELMIGDNIINTEHPYITAADEEKISFDEVERMIDNFSRFNSNTSHKEISEVLFESIGNPKKDNIVDINNIKK